MSFPAQHSAVFFDRDGVLNVDTGYLHRVADFEWIPGAPEAIAYVKQQGHRAIVATNQSGIGRGYYSEADMQQLHAWMNEDLFARTGYRIAAFYHAPFHPDARVPGFRHENHPDRKPNPGMLRRAIQDFDLIPERCLMIGDKDSDMEAARHGNMHGVLFPGGNLLHKMREVCPQLFSPGICGQ